MGTALLPLTPREYLSPMSSRLLLDRQVSIVATLLSLTLLLITTDISDGKPRLTAPTSGLRERPSNWFTLVGGRVVTRPGVILDGATIVIRDGYIKAVGVDIKPPAGAKQIDLTGKTIYAGFVEPFTEFDIKVDPPGPTHWNKKVTPQRTAGGSYRPDTKLDESLRRQGFAARLVIPKQGVIKGTSCIALTDGSPANESLIARQVATHLKLTVPFSMGGENSSYPNSPMGAVALARQAMLDASWRRDAVANAVSNPTALRLEANLALESLADCLDGGRLVIAEASNELFVLRADQFAREFALRLAVRGSGNEYRRLDEIAATGRPLIVPINFPKPPPVASPDAAADATLEELMHWRLAPENPARLRSAGVTIALTSHGLKDRNEFLKRVRKAVKRGLSADDALAALTTAPSELLGIGQQLGTIEQGKLANLVVTDRDLFTTDAKVLSTWVAGQKFEIEAPTPAIVGSWQLTTRGIEQPVVLHVTGERAKLKATIGLTDNDKNDKEGKDEKGEDKNESNKRKAKLKDLRFNQGRLTARVAGALLGIKGDALLAVTLLDRGEGEKLIGTIKPIDGDAIVLTAKRQDDNISDNGEDESESATQIEIELAVNYPLGAYGRTKEPEQPKVVLFRNATIWTCGKDGLLEQADVLIRDGVIEAVGAGIEVPTSAVLVDATGKHLTPGIIDCHSHMATDGGLNEWSQAVTAEVRIADFLDPDDITIYRQLAGGVTSANVLHGSANPIGGQNQVIKLRWGGSSDALRFDGAPAGIKFALGENVKQSNWGGNHTTRYPQTRMGVDEIMIDAFHAARAYQTEHAAWRSNPVRPAPRRDLELEAIVQILDGERWIHCHSYRQSEILTFLRNARTFWCNGWFVATHPRRLQGCP